MLDVSFLPSIRYPASFSFLLKSCTSMRTESDAPARRRVYRRVRRVRQVKGFGAELQPAAFSDAELLEDREVKRLEADFAQNIRARIAIGELRWQHCIASAIFSPQPYRRIKVLNAAKTDARISAEAQKEALRQRAGADHRSALLKS